MLNLVVAQKTLLIFLCFQLQFDKSTMHGLQRGNNDIHTVMYGDECEPNENRLDHINNPNLELKSIM